MADNSKVELIIEVDTAKGNASIKGVNKSLEDLERQAINSGKRASQGIDKLTDSFRNVGTAVQNFAHDPLSAVQGGIDSLLTKMGPVAVGFGAIATGAAAAGYAIFKIADNASEAAEQIKNLSNATGLGVEEIQNLQRLSKERGLDDLTGVIEKLNVQLGSKAGGDFTEAILRMNIAVKQGADQFYYLEEMRQHYQALKKEIGDVATAQQMAADLGRRLVGSLGPLLMSDESITKGMNEIGKSGATMNAAQIERLLVLRKEIEETGRVWESWKNKLKIIASEVSLAFMRSMIPQNPWNTPSFRGKGASDQWGEPESINQTNNALSEVDRRARIIAQADAVAAGTKRELIPLTVKLNDLEKQYTEEKSKQNGLQFASDKVNSLAAQIAATKSTIDATKAQTESYAAILKELDRSSDASGRRAEMAKLLIDTSNTAEDPFYKLAMEGNAPKDDFAEKLKKDLEKVNQETWDENQKIALDRINNIRDAAGHIFDDLMTGSKNIWSDLLNTFKNVFLAPVRMLFQNLAQSLFFGGGAGKAGAAGGMGGLLGGLGGIFAGGGGIGPGGTPPFLQSATGGAGGSAIGSGINAASSLGGLSGIGGMFAHVAPFLANPYIIGPAIAAVGIFSLFKLFGESPEEKMRKKVKAAYGVDIKDKGVQGQLVALARQSFVGNFDRAIQSAQAQQMIQQYADMTGQTARGMRAAMTSSTLVQSGGGLYQAASYSNGNLMPMSGGLPGMSLGGVSLAGSGSAGPTIINISVPGAAEFFKRETVQVILNNPKASQAAVVQATKSSSNRRELTALQLAPGTLTS